MAACPNEIEINGTTYVKASSLACGAAGPVVIIRTVAAGVHYGELASRTDQEVVLKNARRLWYWKGAASLSQLAVDGVSAPKECKFSVIVPEITLLDAIEVIPVSTTARAVIDAVPFWRA